MKKNTIISLIILLIGIFITDYFFISKQNLISKKSNEKSSGEALIGGDFELVDINNKKYSSDKLKGKFSVIYFGFTNCPMICPTALNTLGLVMNELGDKTNDINFVFITTDPERDTPERLKEFLPNFNKNLIGLTGTTKQLKKAYQGYKVYAEKVFSDNKNKAEYDMNHSSIIYVMDKKGKYISHFSHESKVEEILKELSKLIK